ncbi:MAG: UDP-3-O-(3-hydroxymyristoyl)glucosamine N-acyltransferase [FCB group bacterium]|nr:UDP-3-O-(3-hydroxymyristoyl)glucosamine N-acyltransferase [FCB group bacterium]
MTKKTNIAITIEALAQAVEANFDGDGSISISGAAPITKAGPGEITFIANEKYIKFLESTKASAIVLDKDTLCPRHITVIRHDNPYLTFARIIDILYPKEPQIPIGVDSSSIVEKGVEISPSSHIGPLCHIKNNTKIGNNTQLLSSVYIGNNVTIGNNCLIYPGVIILDDTKIGDNVIIHASTVIGSDGFGYAESDKGLKKIKQIGWVEIDNDVEIGSNCSVDRGALGPTKIGRGTKIDNLVQIAHNVEIGNNCIIVSQVGISGSTKLGHGVILAGQVGVVGHLEIGDGARVGAQSGVSKSVPAGKTVFGSPARNIMQTKRIEASLVRLPELLKRVKIIEKKIQD